MSYPLRGLPDWQKYSGKSGKSRHTTESRLSVVMNGHAGMSAWLVARGNKWKGTKLMKNILIVQGGGRTKGNTAQLVEYFIKGAKEAGHKTELISLLKNEVKGCLGCNACRYGKPCVQKDSFNEMVPKIKNADC